MSCLSSDIAKSPGRCSVGVNIQQQFFKANIPVQFVTGSGILKPKLYPCKICGRAYKWKKTLLRHMRLECGKEPQFQCPYCPQKSKFKFNLQQHVLSKHSSQHSKADLFWQPFQQ